MAIHNLTREGLDQYEYSSAPIELPLTNPIPSSKYALGRGDCFPKSRQTEKHDISIDPDEAVEKWFQSSRIQVGSIANTAERVAKTKQLFYTWRDCFAENVCDIKATDLIEHSIDFLPKARPVMGKVPKYTNAEHAFANEIFPQMEDAGIITRRSS